MCVCVCLSVYLSVCLSVCVSVSVGIVIVKRPVLPPCAVGGRSRNPLYYFLLLSVYLSVLGIMMCVSCSFVVAFS